MSLAMRKLVFVVSLMTASISPPARRMTPSASTQRSPLSPESKM